MSGKKTIVWSGKINLGNYESLGFEVSGEVDTPDEAIDLALFEAGQLIGLANRANPATAEALRTCGYDDVEIGSIEHGGKTHLLLIGLDRETRFGDRQMGCIAVLPVEVE